MKGGGIDRKDAMIIKTVLSPGRDGLFGAQSAAPAGAALNVINLRRKMFWLKGKVIELTKRLSFF